MYNNGLTFLDFLRILWRHKVLIVVLGLGFFCGAYFHVHSLPTMYKSECRVLPINQSTNNNSLLSQIVGLRSVLSRGSSNGQLMLSIIRGDVVIDAIIEKFSLMGDSVSATRNAVVRKLQTSEEDRSGILTIGVVDTDPVRAAQMANAFVDELQKRVKELSLREAVQQRIFFEEYLVESRQRMETAENNLQEFQEDNSLFFPEAQLRDLSNALNRLNNQISAKKVEIASLETYAKDKNPQLKKARSQLDAMLKELKELNELEVIHELNAADEFEDKISLAQAPEIEREYKRLNRNVQITSALYEALLKQVENAKMSELGSFSPLQIIDPATPSDIVYSRSNRDFILKCTVVGIFLGCAWSVFVDYVWKLFKPEVQRKNATQKNSDDTD